MNRRKKLNQILRTNAKKASAKLAPASKNRYVSKADRAKLAEEAVADDQGGNAPGAVHTPVGARLPAKPK